jgi:hypothetical protein
MPSEKISGQGFRPDTFYDPLRTELRFGYGVRHQSDSDVLIRHSQDIEPTFKFTSWMRENERSKPGEFRPICRLDPVTYLKLYNRGIAPDQDKVAFRRWLDTEGKWWKTTNKKLWIPNELRSKKTSKRRP